MLACVQGRLHEVDVEMERDNFSAVVITSAGGYPGKYENGKEIQMRNRHSTKGAFRTS